MDIYGKSSMLMILYEYLFLNDPLDLIELCFFLVNILSPLETMFLLLLHSPWYHAPIVVHVTPIFPPDIMLFSSSTLTSKISSSTYYPHTCSWFFKFWFEKCTIRFRGPQNPKNDYYISENWLWLIYTRPPPLVALSFIIFNMGISCIEVLLCIWNLYQWVHNVKII